MFYIQGLSEELLWQKHIKFHEIWVYQEDIKAKVRHVEVDKFGLLLLHNFPHHFLSLATLQRKFGIQIPLLSFWCVFFSN